MPRKNLLRPLPVINMTFPPTTQKPINLAVVQKIKSHGNLIKIEKTIPTNLIQPILNTDIAATKREDTRKENMAERESTRVTVIEKELDKESILVVMKGRESILVVTKGRESILVAMNENGNILVVTD